MKPSTYETRAEQLNTEDNRARYDERNAHRKELVSNLSELLQQDADSNTIVSRLTELGFKTEEGFSEKTADEMKEGVRELITHLEEASNGVLKVTNAVREDIAGATETAAETTEGADKIRATLDELTEGRYLSVEAMNETLKRLKGVKVEIPADEIARLNGLFPNELSQETLLRIEKVKDQTEGENGSLVMQLPAKVMVDGQENPFTIAVMQEIMRKAANADSSLKPLWLSNYVPEDVKSKVWDSALAVWTSACLKGSKSKNYKDQLRHQADILGAEYGIEADMILAMALRYISGKEELMRQDFMRLNTRGTDGDPLGVGVDGYDLDLDSSSTDAPRSDGGVGVSFRISS